MEIAMRSNRGPKIRSWWPAEHPRMPPADPPNPGSAAKSDFQPWRLPTLLSSRWTGLSPSELTLASMPGVGWHDVGSAASRRARWEHWRSHFEGSQAGHPWWNRAARHEPDGEQQWRRPRLLDGSSAGIGSENQPPGDPAVHSTTASTASAHSPTMLAASAE
jgi:hypothetical protein